MENSLYIQKTLTDSVGNNIAVKFDSIVSNIGSITYNPLTGIITLNSVGEYHIQWWLTSQATQSQSLTFSLVSSEGANIKGDSNLKTGVLTGVSIVSVSSEPVTISLNNISGNTVYFPTTVAVKGMLCITMSESVGSSDTMYNFQIAQLTNVLSQIIGLYPENILSVFVRGMYYVIGTPTSLYSGTDGPGLFIITDEGDVQAIPLSMITAVYAGDGSTYNEGITYLTPSLPYPPGWDTNVITSVHDYLPVGTSASVVFSIGNSRDGYVFKDPYGMVVITADMEGGQPTFIPATEASIIIFAPPTETKKTVKKVLKIDNEIINNIKK